VRRLLPRATGSPRLLSRRVSKDNRTWRARDENDANDPEETFIDASAVAIRARRVDVRLASGAPVILALPAKKRGKIHAAGCKFSLISGSRSGSANQSASCKIVSLRLHGATARPRTPPAVF
jgi:hypothetical protein